MIAFPFIVFEVIAGSLQTYADGIRTSTAGREVRPESVISAVHHDPDLTVQQQLALEELYAAFREITQGRRAGLKV